MAHYTDEERDALAQRVGAAIEDGLRPLLDELAIDTSLCPPIIPAALTQAHVIGIVAAISSAVETFGLDGNYLAECAAKSILGTMMLRTRPDGKLH